MKMIVEYIEHALTFERLAAEEGNRELKNELTWLARAYRKLVGERKAVRITAAERPPLSDSGRASRSFAINTRARGRAQRQHSPQDQQR